MVSVLLIDDDPVAAKLLKGFLACRFGDRCDVVHASTLTSALRVLRQRRFDHVLLDNRLPPYTDYRETLPLVRNEAGGTEPIIVSVSPDDGCFDERAAFGAPRLVDKFALRAAIGAGLLG